LDDLDPTSIMNATSPSVEKFKDTNPKLSNFFSDIQSQLLQYAQDLYNEDDADDAIYPDGEKQVENRYQHQYLRQKDQNQTNKITEREQKIGVFGDEHVPMTRQQLGVNYKFNVSVKQ
jgi:DNA-directed RNA polymerase specialized sigma subunit